MVRPSHCVCYCYDVIITSSGLPAHQAEIMVGDVVVEVDRTDVMKADAELVQNLIM